MDEKERKIEKLRKELETLPKGNITYKTIRGAKRMYLYGKYIKAANEAKTLALVDRRNKVEAELKNLLMEEPVVYGAPSSEDEYLTNVIRGEKLRPYVDGVRKYKKRECFESLRGFLESDRTGKVCLIYGLRRTGKTIMIFQAIEELDLDKAAYIKIMSSDNMAKLNSDLKSLSQNGVEYVFIDEITLMTDFIDSASLLSDVYAMGGMKIVLAGTDSLGFVFAGDEELYDRAVTIHTTFIPYREYASLLGIHYIDEYIRYGGTFRVGDTDFEDPEFSDEGISFRDDESTRRYIDTAIARNIQHSLSCYKGGEHFRNLIDLYEADELTNAVNRIIEDMNHRFLASVITREFKSNDLGSAAQIDRKRAALEGRISILDKVDKVGVLARFKKILDIKDKSDLTVDVTPDHISEIKEYLKLLELIIDCPTESIGSSPAEHIIFTQPGMRYCQAQALVYSIMKDEEFKQFSLVERDQICNIILEDVKGRMLEEIVLLETKKTLPRGKRVFKLVFAVGEFDMVIADEKTLTCEIFEIKHTENVFAAQYKNMIDEEKCRAAEHDFGEIVGKTVLYRGEDTEAEGIKYRNVTRYLEGLHK